MPNVTQAPDRRGPDQTPDPGNWPPLPLPKITPLFTRLLEEAAAERGLPPEPWAA